MITQPVTAIDELRDIVPVWNKLARHAVEPNAFYESWALLPALEQLSRVDSPVTVLLVWADSSHSCLIGLFPLVHEKTYLRFPAPNWSNWLHMHCPLGTPLVHRDYAEQALNGLLEWVNHSDDGLAISFNKIPADGEFAQYWRAALQQRHCSVDEKDRWERALLQSELPAEHYVMSTQRKKKLKEFQRLRRRLEMQGDLDVQVLLPGKTANLSQWINEFITLEKGGWKGRAQTALHCSTQDRLFAEDMMYNAAHQGQLMMLKILLNDRPIAIKLNFVSASQGAYAFKIAYDEEYAAYSPGVLLELENIYASLDTVQVEWMDSCAIPDHPMIDHLWEERREMVNMHASTRHLLSKPLLHTMRLARGLVRAMRA